ncbi:hypothetical protein CJ030_MR3G005804 [Morella rubra]|uniref:RNase H type-1 domain-containing protein n=1 Tax=Morella rubra TaxID=262757 RepID=A0A6A1W3V1_9ROSI|nr:hypothetical protein CJ030_MR3G005804 [Morella rubra]
MVDWRKLWKLRMHAQLRLLLWNLAWNILPTRTGIDAAIHLPTTEDNFCPLCTVCPESIQHLFLFCPISCGIWSEAPWQIMIRSFSALPFSHWLSIILDPTPLGIPSSDFHHFQLYAVNAIDVVWHYRNGITHGESAVNMGFLVERVRRISWQHVTAWQSAPLKLSPTWRPPDPGVIKINVDVAVRNSLSFAACVCRDHLHTVVYVETRKLLMVDPSVCEAEALCLGMEVALRHQWPQVMFEGDSLVAMNAVSRTIGDCPWAIEPAISAFKLCLANHSGFSFSYSPRCANVLAHNIAQWGASSLREGRIPELLGPPLRCPWLYEAAVICDTMWMTRNLLVHQDKSFSAHEMELDMNRRLHEHLAAWSASDQTLQFRWCPPLPDFHKVNFDAAIRGSTAFLGVVFRPPDGSLIHAWGGSVFTSNPLLAEIHAALSACQMVSRIGLEKVIFEGDSILCCRAICDPNFLVEGPLLGFILTIRSLLADHPGWSFSWEPRRQNQMAHLLAQWLSRCFRFGPPDPVLLPFYISAADSVDPP